MITVLGLGLMIDWGKGRYWQQTLDVVAKEEPRGRIDAGLFGNDLVGGGFCLRAGAHGVEVT